MALRRTRRGAFALAAATLACGSSVGMAQVLGSDNYSTDTTANYTAKDETTTEQSVWTVANGTLNYSRTGTATWATGVFLLNPTIASTAGQAATETSGDFIGNKNFNVATTPNYYQPGLVLSGDPTKGGYVIAEYENGKYQYHLVLLRETGGQLVGDEGGTGNPPVIADFGSIKSNLTDDYHISGIIDRTGAHPNFIVSITDLTTGMPVVTGATATDAGAPATYGGNQIGWRVRYDNNNAALSFDNLSVAAVPEPASVGLLAVGAVGLLARRRRVS